MPLVYLLCIPHAGNGKEINHRFNSLRIWDKFNNGGEELVRHISRERNKLSKCLLLNHSFINLYQYLERIFGYRQLGNIRQFCRKRLAAIWASGFLNLNPSVASVISVAIKSRCGSFAVDSRSSLLVTLPGKPS